MTVEVIEPMPGDWEMLRATLPHEKIQASTARFASPSRKRARPSCPIACGCASSRRCRAVDRPRGPGDPRTGPVAMRARPLLVALLLLGGALPAAGADDAQRLARGLQAVQRMAGCFLVDYSYVEVQALKPGYVRDPRVYDVNRDKSAKEWIIAEPISPRRIRLQRVLFLADLAAWAPTARCGTSRRTGSSTPRSSTTSWPRCTGSRATCAPRPVCGPAA